MTTNHRLLLVLSVVSLAVSVLALAMALAFVNPWREPECKPSDQSSRAPSPGSAWEMSDTQPS